VNRIITINDKRYRVLGTASADLNYSPEELKKQWNADTVLRNGNDLYLADELIIAEFEDIEQ